jgi:hypothetical protein
MGRLRVAAGGAAVMVVAIVITAGLKASGY